MSVSFSISKGLVEQTLADLRVAGRRNSEGIVLWFAPRANRRTISKVLVPIHNASDDYFDITPEGNRQLREICQRERLILEAQIHTHPEHAFHSKADDRLAVVRHVHALSIVLPDFAARTTVDNFITHSAAFMLAEDDTWVNVPHKDFVKILTITN